MCAMDCPALELFLLKYIVGPFKGSSGYIQFVQMYQENFLSLTTSIPTEGE